MNTSETISARQVDAIVQSGVRRHTLRQILLSFFAAMAVAGAVFSFWVWVHGGPGAGEVLVGLLTQGISMVLLAKLWLSNHRLRRRIAALAQPCADSVRAALDQVGVELRQQRLLRLVLALIVGPLFGISLFQLVGSGKMKVIEAVWAGSFIALIIVMISLIVHHRIRNQLEPKRRQLQSLARQFGDS